MYRFFPDGTYLPSSLSLKFILDGASINRLCLSLYMDSLSVVIRKKSPFFVERLTSFKLMMASLHCPSFHYNNRTSIIDIVIINLSSIIIIFCIYSRQMNTLVFEDVRTIAFIGKVSELPPVDIHRMMVKPPNVISFESNRLIVVPE